MSGNVTIRFWGVRGSVPAPLTAEEVKRKKVQAVRDYLEYHDKKRPPHGDLTGWLDPAVLFTAWEMSGGTPSTYGGNTSCVEIRCGGQIFVLDMGTGLRLLGSSLFPEMVKKGGLNVKFLVSHVHWDHIQGLPFFGPLHINKSSGICNSWEFYGGTDWQRTAEACIQGQMESPVFPVPWKEIGKTTDRITCSDMYDQKQLHFDNGVRVLAGKLNHPQETYGFRLELLRQANVAYTTDNEPYDPSNPDPRLLLLARGTQVWITDCQYTKDQYEGRKDAGGVPRHGWGHSYPEAVAKTAVMAGVETVVLFHHDPASSDEKIAEMAVYTQELINNLGGKSKVIAAYEGLEIQI